MEQTCLLLDVRLVGGKQAAQSSGVQVAQGIARRGRPLRSRLGDTHLLTRRQLPLRLKLSVNRPLLGCKLQKNTFRPSLGDDMALTMLQGVKQKSDTPQTNHNEFLSFVSPGKQIFDQMTGA